MHAWANSGCSFTSAVPGGNRGVFVYTDAPTNPSTKPQAAYRTDWEDIRENTLIHRKVYLLLLGRGIVPYI